MKWACLYTIPPSRQLVVRAVVSFESQASMLCVSFLKFHKDKPLLCFDVNQIIFSRFKLHEKLKLPLIYKQFWSSLFETLYHLLPHTLRIGTARQKKPWRLFDIVLTLHYFCALKILCFGEKNVKIILPTLSLFPLLVLRCYTCTKLFKLSEQSKS